MKIRARHLIQIDWIAGAVVGVAVLALHRWLSELYQLSMSLVLTMGIVNLAYASVSFTLAMRSRGDRVPGLRIVAIANMLWAVICVMLAVIWRGHASLLGMSTLLFEAVFVGGLGILEWRAGRNLHQVSGLELNPIHE